MVIPNFMKNGFGNLLHLYKYHTGGNERSTNFKTSQISVSFLITVGSAVPSKACLAHCAKPITNILKPISNPFLFCWFELLATAFSFFLRLLFLYAVVGTLSIPENVICENTTTLYRMNSKLRQYDWVLKVTPEQRILILLFSFLPVPYPSLTRYLFLWRSVIHIWKESLQLVLVNAI